MDLKKYAPWNWFKKEEEQQVTALPVQRPGQLHRDNPLAQFHQEIDRVFDGFFRGFGLPSTVFGREFAPLAGNGRLKPTLDITAADREYTISVELPGIEEKDVQLELSDNTLVIRGEKKHEKEEKEENYYRMERSYGSFQRVLCLPEDAEQDGIGASYKRGVLTVTIPRKAQPVTKIKQIAVSKG